jgi:hypothetical protein
MALFKHTTADVRPPAAAVIFIEKARRIATSFEIAESQYPLRGLQDLSASHADHRNPDWEAR